MPYVEAKVIVDCSKEEAYLLAKDMENYPCFMENVQQVKVINRQDNATVTDWITNVDGRVIKWREEDIFFEDEPKILYRLISGDLKKFEGEWRFEESPQGTVITLTVDFEFGIPMLAGLLNPILKQKTRANCQEMLSAIKRQVESKAS